MKQKKDPNFGVWRRREGFGIKRVVSSWQEKGGGVSIRLVWLWGKRENEFVVIGE